jgi:dephospho-CoA kinase
MIQAFGVPVLDADTLAREVVEPGQPAYAEIAAAWPDVVRADGAIDRNRLASVVFADPTARARLEAITHPRIHERALVQARAFAEDGHRLAFYEASLLVETGRHRDFAALVVVTATDEQQIARVVARDGASQNEVQARLNAQLPVAAKQAAATHLIDNSGDLENTRRQVEALVARVLSSSLRAASP